MTLIGTMNCTKPYKCTAVNRTHKWIYEEQRINITSDQLREVFMTFAVQDREFSEKYCAHTYAIVLREDYYDIRCGQGMS